eukprot:1072684-Prorocentrum_lima.AAC.1
MTAATRLCTFEVAFNSSSQLSCFFRTHCASQCPYSATSSSWPRLSSTTAALTVAANPRPIR